jgi:hypothetical protein
VVFLNWRFVRLAILGASVFAIARYFTARPRKATQRDIAENEKLDHSLEETFPASDPVAHY